MKPPLTLEKMGTRLKPCPSFIIAKYNGLPQPRAMACGPDSRFGTLVIRHGIQSNFLRETLLTVGNFRIGDNPTETWKSPLIWLSERIGLKSILENLRATSGRLVHVLVTESRLTGSMYL